MLQTCDVPHAFIFYNTKPVTREPEFSWVSNFMQKVPTPLVLLFYISAKSNNKIKEKVPFFGHFLPFLPMGGLAKKIGTVTQNTTWPSNIIMSLRKKLMSQFQENFHRVEKTDGRMKGCIDPHSYVPSSDGWEAGAISFFSFNKNNISPPGRYKSCPLTIVLFHTKTKISTSI